MLDNYRLNLVYTKKGVPLLYNKAILCFILILFSFCILGQSEVIFVKKGGIGSGKSWNDPLGNLQDALALSKFGTQIWVAEGIYHTTETSNRNIRFEIPDGIQLYGGFQGNETQISERIPQHYPTILTGEIGDKSNQRDNAFTVIYTKNVSKKTIVDGFHIVAGFAEEHKKPQGHPTRSGAGWYNDGANNSSNPTIKNCLFSDNQAMDGGAIYNNGKCTVILENCIFIGNIAISDGGAVYNGCHNGGIAHSNFSNCQFIKNEANNGGGIFNYNITGNSVINLSQGNFIQNTAFAHGAALYNYSNNTKGANINNCHFEENESGLEESIIFKYGDRKTYQSKKKVNYQIFRS